MSDLMPCPFCGGRVHLREYAYILGDAQGISPLEAATLAPREFEPAQVSEKKRYQVQCSECYCGTTNRFETADYAIAAWNRRVASAEIEAMRRERDAHCACHWVDDKLEQCIYHDGVERAWEGAEAALAAANARIAELEARMVTEEEARAALDFWIRRFPDDGNRAHGRLVQVMTGALEAALAARGKRQEPGT